MKNQRHTSPRVSVIVPVFDVEDQIADCIASLRAQSGVTFEVIVVDDGARDASAVRALAAMAGDNRFRLIRQDNRGLSAARNTGLAHATAPLIAFVDGDDQVAPDFLWQMVQAMEQTGADWVACAIAFRHTNPDTPGHGALHSAIHGAADLSRHGALRRYPLEDWRDVARHFPSAWNKLYRRDLIEGLTFPEGTWFEDHQFYWQAAARTDHIVHLPRPLYIQTRGRAGQITAQDDNRIAQQFDVLRALKKIIADGDKSHGSQAFARIASRLLFERSTVLRVPERRARYLRDAALFLRENHISYSPEWDSDIALTFGLELDGLLPLSVVIPWNGTGDLDATLTSLARLHGPGREILLICDRAETAATVDLAGHPEASAFVQTGRGTGRARDEGLTRARGEFVLFLRAGDIVLPGALQALADRMLKAEADLGLMAHLDPQGQTCAPFFVDPPDPGALSGSDLLELRRALSATLFRRTALCAASLSFGTVPRGDWSVILRAAHAARSVERLDQLGVRLAARSRHAPRARDLLRGHHALTMSLPRDLTRAFPPGWQTRLFTRALHDALKRMDGPMPPSRQRLFLTAILAARPDRHPRRTDTPKFDPDIPRALRRFVTAGHLVRDGLNAPPTLFETLTRPDIALASDLSHALYVPLRPGDVLQCCARFDRKTRFANLGLLDRDGIDAPLHVSLQAENGLIACNDFHDGTWGEVLHAAFDVQGRDDVEFRLTVGTSQIDIALDGVTVFAFGDGQASTRFADLDAVRFIDPAGGIDISTIQLTRVPAMLSQSTAPRGRLILDDRLILRGGLRRNVSARLRITGDAEIAPPMLIHDSKAATHQVSAALPGRVWQHAKRLNIQVLDTTGADLLPPLTITRSDVLARLETLLSNPDLRADTEAAMLVIEHARFAELTTGLSVSAQHALEALVRFYRLGDFLPPVPRDTSWQIDGGPVLLNAALSRVSHALAADPAPNVDAVLAQIVLPRPLFQTHLLELSETFTCDRRDPGPLLRHARRSDAPPFAPGADIWRNSAMLPFLWDQGRVDLVIDAIRSMVPDTGRWYATSPLAWVMGQALSDDTLLPFDRDAIAKGFMDFAAGDLGAYPRRAVCFALTLAAAQLVLHRDRLSSDLRSRVPKWAGRTFGTSPDFWDQLSQIRESGTLPAELIVFRRAFDTLVRPVNPSLPHPTAAAVHDAFQIFDAAVAPDTARIQRELLGPAGAPLDTRQLSGSDILRHMAFPGASEITDPVLIDAARNALPDFYVNTPQSPDAELQMRVGRHMAAFSAPVPSGDCADILADLIPMAGPDFHHLGIGLALRLAALADDAGAALVQDWLSTLKVAHFADRPAIRSGLSILRRADAGRAQEAARILECVRHVIPDTPDPDTASGPLHDIIVVVVSCQANLGTRIPALRDGWLGQLAARDIPHVVVVGDGDGRREGDVVRLDAPDDYEGLPQKTLAAIDWVYETTPAGHMLKVDDDCFVNVEAFFDSLTYMKFDYHGRLLSRLTGHMDRAWHMGKSHSERGRLELDRSPEPSIYADGGTGYTLSRRAMGAVRTAAASPEGRHLIAASFMEDKMLGDLLRLQGIGLDNEDYHVTVRRRTHPNAIPVPLWVNGFDASRATPVKLVHLDTHLHQKAALDRLKTPDVAPKKIWPSFQDLRLGYLSHALEQIGPIDRIERLRAAPVAVMAVMRNEMFLMPHFLDHYRKLGVGAFAIADNLSDDGTLEYLEAQPDVALFSVDTEYRLSQYGVAWQQALLSAFRVGRWSLLADADEFLTWQDPQRQSLPDLLNEADFQDADAARIFMLDMYPDGPLVDADFAAARPFAQAGFCDVRPFLAGNPGKGPFSNSDTWTSALRHRLIPGSRPQLFVAQKYALLRYHPFLQLSAGLHYVSGARRIAPRELLFAHFKYNADFRRKALAEVARGQHFNDAEEYRRYLALTSEGCETVFEDGVSVPWTRSPFVRARLDGSRAPDRS